MSNTIKNGGGAFTKECCKPGRTKAELKKLKWVSIFGLSVFQIFAVIVFKNFLISSALFILTVLIIQDINKSLEN